MRKLKQTLSYIRICVISDCLSSSFLKSSCMFSSSVKIVGEAGWSTWASPAGCASSANPHRVRAPEQASPFGACFLGHEMGKE